MLDSPAGPGPDILTGVSRETRDALEVYVRELRRWQVVKNLVGPRTLDDVWTRHVADSLQLAPLGPGGVWADLGSGAGLPGLVIAIARPGTLVHLIESDRRKCAFLRQAARLCGASVRIWDERIETAAAKLDPVPDIVTARALATLDKLLELSEPLLRNGAIGLFPKGRDHRSELTHAAECWKFSADLIPSRTDPEGSILRIRDFAGRLHEAPSGTR